MRNLFKMNVYCGWFRTTVVKRRITRLSDFAGSIPCLECGGTGDWPYGYDGVQTCINCKGTGKQLISI